MSVDDRQRDWLARVHEHKALARLLRAGRLRGADRARYDALTRSLLDDLAADRSAVAVEEIVRVAPAPLGLCAPYKRVECVDAAGVVARLRHRAESA